MKFLKCIHLDEKTGDQPTERNKPSTLGEKTGDKLSQRDKLSYLGGKSRGHANSTRQALQSWCVKTTIINSLQLVKRQQITHKSVGFHHGALGNTIVLVHLFVRVVRQRAVIQMPEMGQYFQVNGKKSQLFKNFPLVRAPDEDEASVSLGQVTKFDPDAESQIF
ncbi:hypothetical protein TNCV_1780481 [Trichonephila clavipes]|nr:hypothetical protein TNCV_1780481 [Trichonephila clavipes]